jgi:hypothetical protein
VDERRDDAMGEVTRKVVHLVTREHPLTGNQLFELASHLTRLATHRIVEERLRKRPDPSND